MKLILQIDKGRQEEVLDHLDAVASVETHERIGNGQCAVTLRGGSHATKISVETLLQKAGVVFRVDAK